MTGTIEFRTLEPDRVRWSVVTPDGEIVATGITTMKGLSPTGRRAMRSEK